MEDNNDEILDQQFKYIQDKVNHEFEQQSGIPNFFKGKRLKLNTDHYKDIELVYGNPLPLPKSLITYFDKRKL